MKEYYKGNSERLKKKRELNKKWKIENKDKLKESRIKSDKKYYPKKLLKRQSIEEKEKIKIRYFAWYHLKKDLIKKYKGCQMCTSKNKLEIHHKDYSQGNKLSNLMILCSTCHRKEHKENEGIAQD